MKAFLTGRLAQLAARYLGIGLAAWAAKRGINVGSAEALAADLLPILAALMCFAWDHYLHGKGE